MNISLDSVPYTKYVSTLTEEKMAHSAAQKFPAQLKNYWGFHANCENVTTAT